MAPMTTEEAWDSLMAGTRTAHVATVRADGRPHVKPVWFELTGPATEFPYRGPARHHGMTGRQAADNVRLCLDLCC